MNHPDKEIFLREELEKRKEENAWRRMRINPALVDFCSNDYLGIARKSMIASSRVFTEGKVAAAPGSTGSRLLTGNYSLLEEFETELATFFNAESALVYNSGYDANTGLLGCIAKEGDTLLFDYLSHASLRDGTRLSRATIRSFAHNDLNDLEDKMKQAGGNIFVVTESVFSMDGDEAPLKQIVQLCQVYHAHLIVDEAHATGITGPRGKGLVSALQLEDFCFARMHTFGKSVGAHGAVILGSSLLKDYLVNFSRSFIYTTALPAAAILAARASFSIFPFMDTERIQLNNLVQEFCKAELRFEKLNSNTPIQGILVPGNDRVKSLAEEMQREGYDVRPILYPTVPKGKERLRIVLHAFNDLQELRGLINAIGGSKKVKPAYP
jgi:8-amino-7-oxononanoate synthase